MLLMWFSLTNRLVVSAVDKGISAGSFRTGAGWNVVDDVASGSLSTSSGAGIDTTLVDASLSSVTVRVENTLGSTTRVRVSEVILHASAASISANRIGSARRWVARINGSLNFLN